MKKINVLIIENMHRIAKNIEKYLLRNYGDYIESIEITGFCSNAKEKINTGKFTAIVWDLHLDDGPSYSLIEFFKNNKQSILLNSGENDTMEVLIKDYHINSAGLDILTVPDKDIYNNKEIVSRFISNAVKILNSKSIKSFGHL
jgi:response regulator of citrate/malate metabolism